VSVLNKGAVGLFRTSKHRPQQKEIQAAKKKMGAQNTKFMGCCYLFGENRAARKTFRSQHALYQLVIPEGNAAENVNKSGIYLSVRKKFPLRIAPIGSDPGGQGLPTAENTRCEPCLG
jgi:hypothetical protein